MTVSPRRLGGSESSPAAATHRSGSGGSSTPALNGRQYLQLTLPAAADEDASVWVENRGLNRWGLKWLAGRVYEGSVWLRALNSGRSGAATVRVALVCGTKSHQLH